jgi:hypothetical protein
LAGSGGGAAGIFGTVNVSGSSWTSTGAGGASNGTGYGSGGGGSVSVGTHAAINGGGGSPGLVRIWEFL